MSLGFYLDMTRCSGCATCQAACKDRMGLLVPGPRPRRVARYQVGTFPNVVGYALSVACNHCESPACTEACPTGAMYKDDEGIVLHDDDVCIKCESCVEACPYDAPLLAETIDTIVKCDTCKPLREAGEEPVCVHACPYRALDFGDMDELRSKYGDDLTSDAAPLPDSSMTGPNLLIKAKEAAASGDFREVTY